MKKNIQQKQNPDKTFKIEVRIKKKFLGRGIGKSKKESEQAAAHEALKTIRHSGLD